MANTVMYLLALVLAVGVYNANSAVAAPRVQQNVASCLRTGGICGLASTCPEPVVGHRGEDLCGGQVGVTCCATLPAVAIPCHQRGGECSSKQTCPTKIQDALGTCPGNLVCCVWTN